MTDRVFLDTNVLVYAFDQSAPEKAARSREILARHGTDQTLVLSTQVLQEFYVTATRKLGIPAGKAAEIVEALAGLELVQIDLAVIRAAMRRSHQDQTSFWDALIVEAALAGRCTRLLSEDLQAGRWFGSLQLENPFLKT
jgi:predicted nucleic acid-binding protein